MAWIWTGRAEPARAAERPLGGAWLDALLPLNCVECGQRLRTRDWRRPPAFCAPCEAALPIWRRADGCPRCGALPEPGTTTGCPGCLARAHPLHACHVAFRYAPPITRLVPGLKRLDRRGPVPTPLLRAIDALSVRLAERVVREAAGEIDLIVPLPLHPRRLRARGFNPASLVAHPLGRRLGLPVRPDLLTRVRETRPQAGLRGEARRANVRGAFGSPGPSLEGLRIAVVDDVLTTGETLAAAANALLDADALEVRGLALAATLPPLARAPRRRPARARRGGGPYPPRPPDAGSVLEDER